MSQAGGGGVRLPAGHNQNRRSVGNDGGPEDAKESKHRRPKIARSGTRPISLPPQERTAARKREENNPKRKTAGLTLAPCCSLDLRRSRQIGTSKVDSHRIVTHVTGTFFRHEGCKRQPGANFDYSTLALAAS